MRGRLFAGRFMKPEYKLPTAGGLAWNAFRLTLTPGTLPVLQLGQRETVYADPARQFHRTGRALPPQQCFRRQKALVAGLLTADGGSRLRDHPEPDGRGQPGQGSLREAGVRAVVLDERLVRAVGHVLQIIG